MAKEQLKIKTASGGQISEVIKNIARDFVNYFVPTEGELLIFTDPKTGAYFTECHVSAKKIVELGTIDVPLDPDEQVEYRANRDIVENHPAYDLMRKDAKAKRIFSNLIAEYTDKFKPEKPLKIIGGQHRFIAIEEALADGVNEIHGVKVYFNLNTDQRLDAQLISNTNIAVSSDLLDRMFETSQGPQLRDWCQQIGILSDGQDFSDRKQRGLQITVRGARTLIMNYYLGREIRPENFDSVKTISIIAKTGVIDMEWGDLKKKKGNLWNEKNLQETGKAFAKLVKTQKEYYLSKTRKKNYEFADKALSYSVLSAWSYIAGLLSHNTKRQKRHFNLCLRKEIDPLNASAMAKGRHKSDPENYRGMGTRTDVKERGRLAELFFLQAEKGEGISKTLIDLAIAKYHAKKAALEVKELESKITK